MEIMEILQDAFKYPLDNIQALVVYVILGIIAAIALGGTLVGIAFGVSSKNIFTAGIVGITGFVISFIILLLISGYELDITQYGIRRSMESPRIDFVRQVTNGVKLFIVQFVYFLVPTIITYVLGLFLKNWILYIIALVLFIVFALAAFMAQCRLAKTEDLSSALEINEAINDISRVGLVKIISLVAILIVIFAVLILIVGIIATQRGIIGSIGQILAGIVQVYMVFVMARATGLLYSDV